MDKITNFVNLLDEAIVQGLWDEMFLNPDVPKALRTAPSDVVIKFLAKAAQLSPSWTTTRCAVRVESLTGVAWVAAETKEYSKAYVYSLALACQIDPGTYFEVTDKAAEVALLYATFGQLRRHLRRQKAGKQEPPKAQRPWRLEVMMMTQQVVKAET